MSGIVYHTEKISSFTGRLRRSAPGVARGMTDDLGGEMTDKIERRTPVDKGKLKASIHQTPVIMSEESLAAVPAYESSTETDVRYAPYVEHDTGKYGPRGRSYVIRPKRAKALRFYFPRHPDANSNGFVFLASVRHPGSRGVHMFARGSVAMRNPATVNRVVQPELRKWQAAFATARPR